MYLTANTDRPMVYSFGSYRADKHTDKQTDAAENIHRAALCYAGG